MPRPVDPWDADSVQRFLHERGYTHLSARQYGSSVIVESGPKGRTFKRFRLVRDTVHLFFLDFATHSGKWERTPFRDQRDILLEMVTQQFPWVLEE